jgi:hypothetical protein
MLALADCKLVTPRIKEFETCLTAQEVHDLQAPSIGSEDGGFYSYEGSNMMLSSPWLQDTILNVDTQDPFKLIPIVLAVAKAYNIAHNTVCDGRAIVHADNFCSWAWGAGVGIVQESIIEDSVDNAELKTCCSSHHCKCITGFFDNTGSQQAGDNGANADALRQLTTSIACQKKEEAMSNQLCKTKLRERENMMMRRKVGQKRYTNQSSACLKT